MANTTYRIEGTKAVEQPDHAELQGDVARVPRAPKDEKKRVRIDGGALPHKREEDRQGHLSLAPQDGRGVGALRAHRLEHDNQVRRAHDGRRHVEDERIRDQYRIGVWPR